MSNCLPYVALRSRIDAGLASMSIQLRFEMRRKSSCFRLVDKRFKYYNGGGQPLREAKSHNLYSDTTKSHRKLMGIHMHHPNLFLSHKNMLLNSSEVKIYRKHILQYECNSRMKTGKEQRVARHCTATSTGAYVTNIFYHTTTIHFSFSFHIFKEGGPSVITGLQGTLRLHCTYIYSEKQLQN